MDRSPDAGRQIEVSLQEWRSQSLDIVARVTVALMFPAMCFVAIGWPTSLSLPMRIAGSAIYLAVVGIALCRRADARWRAWLFLLVCYALAAMQLWRAGMAGHGRIMLLLVPLYATLLIDFRSGRIALVLSVLFYVSFAGILHWGWHAQGFEVRENPTELDYWIFQGVLLLVGLVPLAVLLNRFVVRHVQALEAEHRTLAQVREEIAIRTSAQDALIEAARERRRLEEEITRASEKERRRLASELHDGLCQHLTAALLQCAAMENQRAAGKELNGSNIRALGTVLEESMGMAHDIAKGLWPLDFGADALASALERLAKRMEETTGVRCELLEEGDVTIGDEQVALHLYRIAQEAVANAIKHARPQRIALTLRGGASGIQLQVEDDGCGLPQARGPVRGMGLRMMAYRAGILGARLDLENVASGGTRVICTVPCQRDDAGHAGSAETLLRVSKQPNEDSSYGEGS